MKTKFKFGYCLLQYEHNPWLKERMNIGVVLFSLDAGFLKLKTRGWSGRVLDSYPDIQRANFTESLNQIERSFINFERRELKEPGFFPDATVSDVLSKPERQAFCISQFLSPDLDTSFRWAIGGVGVCVSLETKLEQIFQRFVTTHDKPKPEPNRTDSSVWSTFSKKLSERNLDRFISPDKTVQTDLGPVRFQASYQNGSLHVIQPLSFDLSDEERVSSKAAKWASFAQSARNISFGKVQPHFVLGKPLRPSLDESFERAKAYLEKLSGAGNVVTEDNSESFVDSIEEHLSAH
ncbi:DUF3037 domain-containing protein [Phaeobacter inhibens]|uniref:DUF3037 domain-containing protein n=1 Tax=Phaeobacter inhibens TaxID=221822 RepID=UPI0021A43FA5|nr:DUF3037 domain-containing protein [Phaeobacter inhibens]UWS06406.1 DUF3037 domain-containing protein [Phaeobacter inhibens]